MINPTPIGGVYRNPIKMNMIIYFSAYIIISRKLCMLTRKQNY